MKCTKNINLVKKIEDLVVKRGKSLFYIICEGGNQYGKTNKTKVSCVRTGGNQQEKWRKEKKK